MLPLSCSLGGAPVPRRLRAGGVHRHLLPVAVYVPGHPPHPWETRRQIFEIEHGAVLRRIVMDGGMFWDCPDCVVALSLSDLADYRREVRSPTRCFHLTWEAGVLHIRSKPL